MNIKAYQFQELSTVKLYALLRLRSEIFVLEQDCAYQDIDMIDRDCIHINGEEEEKLLAYARIIPPPFAESGNTEIGRLVVAREYRHKGYATSLMQYTTEQCRKRFPHSPIYIKAQNYLEKFYRNLGFVSTGDYFLEDNIPHQAMILDIKAKT